MSEEVGKVTISNRYISVACNCTYNSFELFDDGVVVYGACNGLVFYDLENHKAIKTEVEHEDRVNCVRHIKQSEAGSSKLISCGSDGKIVLWEKKNESSLSYELLGAHKAFRASLPVCDAIETKDGYILLGCISTLSEIHLFKYTLADKQFQLFQTIPLKLSIALDMTFYNLSDNEVENVVLAVGMDTGAVVLYGLDGAVSSTDCKFEPKVTLRKHEDWVRCVSFAKYRGEIYMASGGEDSFIAIWRFTTSEVEVSQFEFQVHKFGKFNIVFDSIIMGHEGWINSLHWNTVNPDKEGGLISCSSDQSVIVWDKGETIWEEKYRFGTIGGQVPGGFGSKANASYLVTCSFQGALQIWKVGDGEERWILEPSVTGHFGEVSDMDYDPTGTYIITTSLDQTTRAHSPWMDDNWHEVSRPQIHGHDIFTVKTLGDYIVSGAEEKILRVFQPTDVFQRNLENATEKPIDFLEHVTAAATLPALGLSNLSEVPNELQEASMPHFSELPLSARLDEDFLRSQTLWPEVSKLYGHVYEISCIATSTKLKLIASGSQSSKPQFSSIILWSAESFTSLGEFHFHKLNVTDMEFSPSGDFLLSGSRDRTWALWKVEQDTKSSLVFLESGAFHTRALWVTTWAPDSSYFLTGARDKKLACWAKPLDSDKRQVIASQPFLTSVSSASVNPDSYIVVGLESGHIHLLRLIQKADASFQLSNILVLNQRNAHHLAVKRIKFNPEDKTEFASAGSDHATRVYSICYDSR